VGHLFDKSLRKAVDLLDGKTEERSADERQTNKPETSAAAPAPDAGDSRQEEPAQSDAATGDLSAKKGGSSEAA
jgi:hypothetical protein